MASDKVHEEVRELKYLGFVEAAGSLATVFVVRIYAVAKEWSGATWRPRINDIESKIRDALAPYYHAIKGNEHQVLLFFDQKLDVFVGAVGKHAPHVVKGLLDKTVDVARKVPDFLLDISAEVYRSGIVNTTMAYVGNAEPVAEEYLYLAWKQFLRLPFSPTIVNVASPPTLFVGSKVNQLLSTLRARHVPLVDHVPFIPLKRIETIIKKEA